MRKRVTVAILGRPNVGKSTLFNRILRRREAVVHDDPGVTRDRHYGATVWAGSAFYIVDTGGLLPRARDGIPVLVRQSALRAAEEADLLLLVADLQVGVTDLDLEVAQVVLRSGKPAILAANKAETEAGLRSAHEFFELGLGEPSPISAVHGTGIGELLDRVVQLLPEETPLEPEGDADLRIAIVGKPNVGKSSLLNALLRDDRALVSPEPGTTRDSIDSRLRWHGHEIDLVDTAGLRRHAQMKESVDVFAWLRTMRSIERSDVCLLLLDATLPVSRQDVRIGGFAHRAGRGVVVCYNKWDAINKDTGSTETFRRDFERHFAFLRYAPVLYISALTGTRIHRPLELAWEVGETRSVRIPTPKVNRVLRDAAQRRPPHYHRGGVGQVKYAQQIDIRPPRFCLFVNNPEYFDRSYLRFLNNALRRAFEFRGSVLRIELRKTTKGRGKPHEEEAP